MRRIIILTLFTFILIPCVTAQIFQYLDTHNGLSSSRVISIEQDKKGFMWFLTHEGIDKYNGKEYVHYQLIQDNKTVKFSPNLNTLQTDTAGMIWEIGKSGDIYKYDPYLNQFYLAYTISKNEKINNNLPITAALIDKKNQLWFFIENKQYLYHINIDKLTLLNTPIEEEVNCITEGEGNTYFMGTAHKVYCTKLEGDRLVSVQHPKLNNFHIVNYLYFYPVTQTLIIGTLLDGIYLYNLHTCELTSLSTTIDVNINSIIPCKNDDGNVLIATNGTGVYKLNMFNHQITPYLQADYTHANKMNGNIINDIYMSDDNKVWMATYPAGVTVYSDKYPGYQWLQHALNDEHSLTDNQINYIMEDSDGDIWYATNNGICCYKPHTQQWCSLLSTYQFNTSNRNHVFISLCEASPGIILAGGYMSGMFRINKKDMSYQYISPQTKGITHIRPDKYIRCIYKDTDGLVWAGGYYNLKCIDPQDFSFIQHYNVPYPITCITAKNDDELWIGTINGLYLFNKKRRRIEEVLLSTEIKCINTIYQHEDHSTYIGTHGSGMWVYNNQTHKIAHYYSDNSALISNNIHCILPGKIGKRDLMISTENTITRFNTKEKLFTNWTKEQGLIETTFNPAAGVHTHDHKYIFGGGKGAIEMNDSIMYARRYKSKMIFTDFSIFYQSIKPNKDGSPLEQPIDETTRIVLPHDQNFFTLNISSINYDNPSNVLYTWKLEGFYNQWTTPSTENTIRYTNIGTGNYRLRIRAILKDDNHILEERSIHITIEPPFWATFWAGIIYLMMLALVVVIFLRFLWLKKNGKVSKEKIQFFINTAHDIRTPLTLIKAPLSELQKSQFVSEQDQLNVNLALKSTDNLSDLVTNLINFEKQELYASDLYVCKYELNNYFQQTLDQYRSYAQKKNIQIVFSSEKPNIEVWMDKNKIDSIIRNLITNAMKYTPDGGKINVSLQCSLNYWSVQISDTGIGIPSPEQNKLFKHVFRGRNATNLRITGSGIGMILTYRLIKTHMGKINMWSRENVGTRFKLIFPVDCDKFAHHIFPENNVDKQVKPKEQATTDTNENEPATTDSANDALQLQETTPMQPTTADAKETTYSILIVEDNSELRTFLKRSLIDEYQILEASDGQEAMNIALTQQPSLVLSDIMMPVMRGDEMCFKLKNNIETSHIPIILLTALNDRNSILRGLKTKADKYITKPFDILILKAEIANVLANKELMRERFAQANFSLEDMKQQQPELDLDQQFILKVTAKVKENLQNELNVETLCTAMNMSRSSFYNKIKALTNSSPSDFIRSIRMHEAAELLKSKRYTVSEVSDMLGFSDPKYFTDTFKKYYNVPPSVYMKQN